MRFQSKDRLLNGGLAGINIDTLQGIVDECDRLLAEQVKMR